MPPRISDVYKRQGQYRLSRETYREVLDGLREFVINYDYDSIWEPG